MTASTSRLTYDCPALTGEGGCSLTRSDGTTQDTDGRVPLAAWRTKLETGWTLLTCPSCCTVSINGSGFQIPGVRAFWGDGTAVDVLWVGAVGLAPRSHVVAPRDAVLVEQPGEVGPGVDRGL